MHYSTQTRQRNGQSPQRAGSEALSAHARVCMDGPLLSDTGKTPAGLRSLAAAFHLAHYQDGNLSVAVIRPLSQLPHLQSSNRSFTAAFTDAE